MKATVLLAEAVGFALPELYPNEFESEMHRQAAALLERVDHIFSLEMHGGQTYARVPEESNSVARDFHFKRVVGIRVSFEGKAFHFSRLRGKDVQKTGERIHLRFHATAGFVSGELEPGIVPEPGKLFPQRPPEVLILELIVKLALQEARRER